MRDNNINFTIVNVAAWAATATAVCVALYLTRESECLWALVLPTIYSSYLKSDETIIIEDGEEEE